MHFNILRNASLRLGVLARTHASLARTRASLPKAARLPTYVSHDHETSRLFSYTIPLSQAIANGSSSSRSPSVAPAEPWRCHFEFDEETPTIWTFFDKTTSTWQYIVADMKKAEAVIIDPVLDYDPASGQVSTASADGLLSFAQLKGLTLTTIL